MFSDIVSFEDLLADLKDEYRTQHIQMKMPIISKLCPVDLLPKMPHKPGLHSSKIRKKWLKNRKIKAAATLTGRV